MISIPTSRSAVLAAALLALAAGAAGCMKADAVTCATGVYCPAGWSCAASEKKCIQGLCGNGRIDPGEVCDDGGTTPGRDHGAPLGCSANCRSDESCGNEVWDQAALEVCDPSVAEWAGRCAADCSSTLSCGNGAPNEGEQCDGGPSGTPNVAAETDRCDPDCTWADCRDGYHNVTAGEACDKTAPGQAASCNPDCTVSVCGDDYVNRDGGEQCDDGPGQNRDSANCTSTCQDNFCGDGLRNETAGLRQEQCDEGAANSDTGACTSACKTAVCGDAHVQAGVEDCDTGADSAIEKNACPYGQRPCTVCSECGTRTLTTGPFCGDDITQGEYEECDDGADNGKTVCAYGAQTCSICNSTCNGSITGDPSYCGDDVVQSEHEECDDGNTVDEPWNYECDYGLRTCAVCNSSCSSGRTANGPYCGDWDIDEDYEDCDDFRSLGCGTCVPNTEANGCTILGHQAATGTITIQGTTLLGITFTLGDNSSAGTKDFAFVEGTPAEGEPVQVSIASDTPGETADLAIIAGRLVLAINSAGLNVTASAAEGSAEVQLENKSLGVVGNLEIAVDDPDTTGALTSTGMASGRGCGYDSPCDRNVDCLPGLYCRQSSKTCRWQ